MVTTISFVVGKGSLSHNNRAFIAENVVEERIELDEFYVQQPLKEAYDQIFGQAVAEYNVTQKRKNRKIDDYITKIKNSKNNEKVFYENVVQIGKMTDFGVVDGEGNVTENALLAKDVLDEYVRTFQERNPNLYLFNAVLHMDEATPHLHLDYIPVAHGYKTGMKTRNSLTKALQEMGIEKATSKMDNETVHWQERERQYLTELCAERGIEIETLGVDRDDYTIPEYKDAMRKKDEAEAEIEILNSEKAEIIDFMQAASAKAIKADDELEDKEEQLKEVDERIKVAEKQRNENEKKLLDELSDEKAIKSEISKIEKQAVDLPNLFGGEQMVKIPKKSFQKLLKISKASWGIGRIFNRYKVELENAQNMILRLTNEKESLVERVRNLENFIDFKGLVKAFEEFMIPRGKSTLNKLTYFKEHIHEYNASKKKVVNKKHDLER